MSNIETKTKAYEAELNGDHGDKAHRGQTDTGPQAGVKEGNEKNLIMNKTNHEFKPQHVKLPQPTENQARAQT